MTLLSVKSIKYHGNDLGQWFSTKGDFATTTPQGKDWRHCSLSQQGKGKCCCHIVGTSQEYC